VQSAAADTRNENRQLKDMTMSLRERLKTWFFPPQPLTLKARRRQAVAVLVALAIIMPLVMFVGSVAIPFVRFERSDYWDQFQPGMWVIAEDTFIDSSGIRAARYGQIKDVRYDIHGLVLRKIIRIDIPETRYMGPNGETWVSGNEFPITAKYQPRSDKMIIMGREENAELHVINHDAYRKYNEYSESRRNENR
jgi:hypothetical protein